MKRDDDRIRRLSLGIAAALLTALVGTTISHDGLLPRAFQSDPAGAPTASELASGAPLNSPAAAQDSAPVAQAEIAEPGDGTASPLLHSFPITHLGSGDHALPVVAGEVLATFDPDLSETQVKEQVATLGGSVLERARYSGVYRIKVPRGEDVTGFETSLQQLPGVRSAFPNAIVEGATTTSVNYRSYQWNLPRIDFSLSTVPSPAVSAVTVAVLDTGVAYEDYSANGVTYVRSADLASSPITPGYDFVNNDAHPDDDHQHGTHIANTIAAYGKTLGVAPGAGIMPVKVLAADKRGTELDLVEGILYAVDHGADVINMSLSFQLGYFPSPALESAIARAAENGVVMVASVGNAGSYGISYPAAFPDVISVGASRLLRLFGTTYDVRAEYSNFGTGIDIMAPGGRIDIDANLDLQPDGILAQTCDLNEPGTLRYWYMAGSSQATAHVSGAAAALLAAGAAPRDVWRYMVNSAKTMTTSTYNPLTGAGLIQLEDADTKLKTTGLPVEPLFYVNPVPRLIATSSGQQEVVRVQVLAKDGRKAAGVLVRGAFFGSATKQWVEGVTDSNGLVSFTSPTAPTGQRVAIGFQVVTVVPPGQKMDGRVFQVYGLTPAMAEVYSRMMVDPAVASAQVLYRLEPTDTSLDALFSRTNMQRTWLYKPVGVGLRSGPLVVAMNDLFVNDLLEASPSLVSTINYTFAGSLKSGWGLVASVGGQVIHRTVPRLGSAASFFLIRFDPAMGQVSPGNTYPVVNGYVENFTLLNASFGNGFASSAMADGFASSALGDGFASSALGDGFASSSLGDGFASSALGDGFASSSLGDGFASSAMGDGFVSSSMGAGFASSSLGDGFVSSSLGDDSSTLALMANADDVIELEAVDPTTLIGEETSFPAEPTPEP